ncbi:protein CLEC16A homolog [Caerostris extrusa]|uniref:Protein CLEC16A homolog n=1 Tax=Caerostris extrusa TaxID=172846 RepID=A0AAV4QY77_CAEEX|nr:protein CLEC16A homolog [Caerostris extrusa]
MKQKCGRYVCVQLLQTLNILFENIRNETSLYYLLSNNHVNSIIVHKFDFSDEEVMAYYISFLKTLSLKLNTHTIHFFYNEHTNDFPLYNEAIKFFKHSESMVRIAVRTLTLNVFKVDDKAMLKFIRDKTAAPYFSNLVWFIGEHVMELDKCVKSASEFQIKTKLADLVAEHLDHLHYLNDILCLHIDALNDVLTAHLLNKLLIPLYVYSLVQNVPSSSGEEEKPRVSCIVSLFLLSQVFLIVSHKPLVQQLANTILNAEMSLFSNSSPNIMIHGAGSSEIVSLPSPSSSELSTEKQVIESAVQCDSYSQITYSRGSNITDEEKAVAAKMSNHFETMQRNFSLSNRPFLEAIFNALDCSENDHAALFALCVLYAVGYNPGINQDLLDSVLMPSDKSETKFCYNVCLIEKLIQIINLSCQYSSKIRIATLQMTILLIKQLAVKGAESSLLDRHLAAIEQSREESTLMLRNFYKSEEIFLDMFEDEYEEMKKKRIEFHKRLPCGEVERARRAIRVFFLLRDLSLTLQNEEETQLPLTNISSCFKVNDALDLNNSDIINCTVITKDGQKIKGFMVIEALQLILVDPDNKRGGWGIAKFVGFLQDIEVTGDKDDSRCLHITIHRPSSIAGGSIRSPLLAAKFVFDDHIRCMAAKQRLSKGRQKARQRKLHQIARLLELPDHIQPCPSPLRHSLHSVKAVDVSMLMHRSQSQDTGLRGKASSNSVRHCHHRPLLPTSSRVPGHAAMLKHPEHPTAEERRPSERKRTSSSPSSPRRHGSRSRESSPRQSGSSEEIPLEDMSRIHGSRHGSPSIRRRSSSGLPQARISAPPGLCHIHQQLALSQNVNSTILSDKISVSSSSDRASISSDELFPRNSTLEENSEASVPTGTSMMNTADTSLVVHSPTETCSKPCCVAEQSDEKFHPHSSASRTSEISTPNSGGSKVKGAIQTV